MAAVHPSMAILLFSALLFAVMVDETSAQVSFEPFGWRVFPLEPGSSECPVLIGVKCPAATVFHYYTCCGGLENLGSLCCFHLQNWVILSLAIIGLLLLVQICCCAGCCCTRRDRRAYDTVPLVRV